ncbi:MAG: phage tail protein [Deltaproteobacteria bacterium]|nr:MAG: phage tail protein [Deltaproteobacteria bacterium]
MPDPFIGEIRMFAGNYAPKGWMACEGQILSIQEYPSFYAVIGTMYGGDGTTNFALPNLSGRFPMHFSPTYPLGYQGGRETVTLTELQMPSHTHSSAACVASGVDSPDPTNKYCGIGSGREAPNIYSSNMTDAKMAGNEVSPAGQSQPYYNMPPYLPIYFIIAIEGVFPTRN